MSATDPTTERRMTGARPRPTPGPRAGTRALALAVAALAVVGVVLTWRVFVASAVGQTVEAAVLEGANYGQTTLWTLAEPVLEVVSISFVVVGLGAAVVVALVRRRWALAAQAAILVGGANLTTQVLKRVIERPDLGDAAWGNSLPSGHTTVAASVAAALVLVVPRRARPWVAVLGAGYTAATGVSTLIGQWHRPSDVLAAALVVLAWAGVVCAVGPESSLDPPGPSASRGTAVAAGALALAALAAAVPAVGGLIAAMRAAAAGAVVEPVQTYVAGAFAVVATAAATFAVLVIVRQSTAYRVPD